MEFHICSLHCLKDEMSVSVFYFFQRDKMYLLHNVQRHSAFISVYFVIYIYIYIYIYIDLVIIHLVLLYLTFTDDIKCNKTDITTFREYPLQM